MRFKDKTAIVTGAAGGIGSATAARFLAGGWKIAAGMHQPGMNTTVRPVPASR